MSSNCPNITPDVEYGDGVVYFGPVAESELRKHKKLPRFTAVPSDIILSHLYFGDSDENEYSKNNANDRNDQSTLNHLDESKENTTVIANNSTNVTRQTINYVDQSTLNHLDESKENTSVNANNSTNVTRQTINYVDQSTLNHLDESKENTPVNANNSTNVTRQTINFDEEENENISLELKQSSSKYSTSSFSSPCASQFLPSDKLIETEVLNRYIRMENMSPGETVTNVDDKEESIQENFVCENIDFEKTKVVHENSVNSEISASPCEPVSNVIDLCNNENENNVSDAVNNVCALKYHSQEEKNESLCSDSELGDSEDYSIAVDKYSITPGKLRLFDVRFAKPSFNARSCSGSVSFMDRIEETTSPIVPKNEMSNDTCTNTFLTNSESIQFNKSLNNPNVCVDKFDFEKSTNVMSNTTFPTNDLHKSIEKPKALEMEIESMNSSDLDVTFDDSIYTNKLSTNSGSIILNKSLNEVNQSEYLSRAAEFKFDLEESVITKPKLIVPAINDKEILLNEKNSTNIDVNCFEKPSSIMTQYLNFDQSQIENCNDISSANIKSTLNKFEEDNQSQNNISAVEQTICLETTDLKNKDNSYCIFDDYLKSKLSVIIENRTLEEESMVQNDDEKKVVEDMSSSSVFNNVPSEDTNNETLIKLAKEGIKEVINHAKCSNINDVGVSLINEFNPLKKETEIENNFTNQSIINSGISFNKNNDIIDNCFLSKNGVSQNETNLKTEVENQVNNTTEQILSKDIENNDWSSNSFSQNNLTDISVLNTSELILKSESALKNIHQERVFDITNSMSNSLAEFNKIEQVLLEEDKNVFGFKTPKTQKLLDFSVEQQSPFLVSQEKKQKLLNFSIVEQTPTLNSIPHISFNHNSKKADTSMDFSSVGQMLDLEIMSADEMDFHGSSSNNLMNISAPNVELLANESIETSLSDHSDLSFNQTITETNLNKPDNGMNQLKMNDTEQFSKKKDSIVLINKQIEVNESSNFLNKIAQNKSCNELNIEETTSEERKHGPEHLLNTTVNTESVMDSYQKLSNKYCIQDFSIVEQSSKLKNIETSTSVKSNNNASNLIDMSVGSSYKSFVSSSIPLIVVSSHDESEKTLNSCSSDGADNTAIYFEDSQLYHKEVLTGVPMNDVSLLVESDKGSVSESFHSIGSDHHVQEDKKRKIEPLQESQINEKKIKVDAEELKTPSSMLSKIRNMFRSSEKKLNSSSNPDENNLKSNIPPQKLKFSKCEENKASFAKPSKIPCKVSDISMTKSSEFNLSTFSLNDNIVKSKKTIPKLTGLSVLTDVSNSSTKKYPESRIPSKFQK